MYSLAVLASGRGSNLQALLDAIAAGALKARLAGVFSDKPNCGAVAIARAAGVPALALRPRDYASREAHDQAMFGEIARVQPDLIVCAGYMRIISASAIRRFEGRMVNVHPSLLPRYPGLDTHARALAAGDPEHGASVHAVIPELDAGTVLSQVHLAVAADDSAGSLAQRLLPREHALLVATVGLLAEGRLQLQGGATFDGRPLRSPLRLAADNSFAGAPT